jgi:hypothetical protein
VRRAGIVAFIAAFLLPLSLPPVTAGTGTARRVVAMYSDPGDWVGGGQARLFHNGNASISVSGNAYYLTVGFSGGTLGDSFSADFAAAPGRKLHRGFYANAQRAPFRETGHPGIDISGDGRGCNTIEGSFDVKDIATGPAGGIKVLWITFEQHCEGGIAALFGEIRIGVDARSSAAALPWVLHWPDTYPGAHGTPSPIALLAPVGRSATVASVGIEGLHAGQFEIRDDGCSGKKVGAGQSCRVWVRFSPASGGPKFAALVFHLASGEKRTAKLEGSGIRGVTAFDLTSDPGDYIGQGLTYHYVPTNASLAGGGGRTLAWVGVSGNNGDWWGGVFQAPTGDILAPGSTYPNATRYPFNNGGAGLDWSGNGRGCNTLTGWFAVDEIAFTEREEVRYLRIRFEQHCESADPALHGTLSYRVPSGDQTAPNAVGNLHAVRDDRQITLSWSNPGNGDFAAVIVRRLTGASAPIRPTSGIPTYAGTGTSASVNSGAATSFAVFALDDAGNVSARRVISVAPAG